MKEGLKSETEIFSSDHFSLDSRHEIFTRQICFTKYSLYYIYFKPSGEKYNRLAIFFIPTDVYCRRGKAFRIWD